MTNKKKGNPPKSTRKERNSRIYDKPIDDKSMEIPPQKPKVNPPKPNVDSTNNDNME